MLLRTIYSEKDPQSLNVKIKEGLKVDYFQELGKNHSSLSKAEFLAEYAGLESKVLFIWEGYTSIARLDLRDNPIFPSGNLPFKRLPGCPNDLDVQPHPAIMGAVDVLIASHPALQKGYIAVHMRRGDFSRHYAKIYESVTRIALSVKEVFVTTGLHTMFLSTDGSPKEVSGYFFNINILTLRGCLVVTKTYRFTPVSTNQSKHYFWSMNSIS